MLNNSDKESNILSDVSVVMALTYGVIVIRIFMFNIRKKFPLGILKLFSEYLFYDAHLKTITLQLAK